MPPPGGIGILSASLLSVPLEPELAGGCSLFLLVVLESSDESEGFVGMLPGDVGRSVVLGNDGAPADLLLAEELGAVALELDEELGEDAGGGEVDDEVDEDCSLQPHRTKLPIDIARSNLLEVIIYPCPVGCRRGVNSGLKAVLTIIG